MLVLLVILIAIKLYPRININSENKLLDLRAPKNIIIETHLHQRKKQTSLWGRLIIESIYHLLFQLDKNGCSYKSFMGCVSKVHAREPQTEEDKTLLVEWHRNYRKCWWLGTLTCGFHFRHVWGHKYHCRQSFAKM